MPSSTSTPSRWLANESCAQRLQHLPEGCSIHPSADPEPFARCQHQFQSCVIRSSSPLLCLHQGETHRRRCLQPSQKQGAPQRPKTPAGGKPKAAPKKKSKAATKTARAKPAVSPRPESKGAQILALIGRSQGATLGEIRKTTGWQAHSVRGFLSTAAKKHSLQIESSKTEAGDRVYRIQK